MKINDIVISKKQRNGEVIIPYVIKEFKENNEIRCINILDKYSYTIPQDDLELWIESENICNCKNNNIEFKNNNENKPYVILNTDNCYWKYIVLATSYENPIDYLDEIEHELIIKESNGYEGRILFDLTLCNGINESRYCDMLFYKNRFIYSDNRVIWGNNLDSIFKKYSNNYFKSHLEILDKGVLLRGQIESLKIELGVDY